MQAESQRAPSRTTGKNHVQQLRATAARIHMRRPAVLAYLGIGNSTFYEQIAAGLLPTGIPATPTGSIKVWPVEELDRVQRARAAGWTPDQQRKLVAEIHTARKSAQV